MDLSTPPDDGGKEDDDYEAKLEAPDTCPDMPEQEQPEDLSINVIVQAVTSEIVQRASSPLCEDDKGENSSDTASPNSKSLVSTSEASTRSSNESTTSSSTTTNESSSSATTKVNETMSSVASEALSSSGLMPGEELYSDDSDTAGYYQVSAGSSRHTDTTDSSTGYQRGLLSSSSSSSSESFRSISDMDDSDTSVASSINSNCDDETASNFSYNMDVKEVHSSTNLFRNFQSRMLGDYGRGRDYSKYTQKMMSNLNFVRRLRVQKCFEGHNGCVNSLNFNSSGTWLASGSDDTKIYIWDVSSGRPYMNFYSGHENNVFQSKFMPHSNDSQIVTCARDGKVRLAELSTSGSCRSTKKIAQHNSSAHKLAVDKESPHCLLSAGEDSIVYQIDLRERRPNRLVSVGTNRRGRRIPLYFIDKHPHKEHQFITGGKDHHVRLFDMRNIATGAEAVAEVKKFCPKKFEGARAMTKDITCAVYSFDGSEIVASYNDDDIYLFKSEDEEGADCVSTYSGHRNSATVKGINFFGPCSEYVVSGSDCGHVYFWDKASRQCVQIVRGDDGVVNVLEPHPIYPYMAVSGLAHDVKLLMPIAREPNNIRKYKKLVKRNIKHREMDSFLVSAALDRQIFLSAMGRHGRRARNPDAVFDTDSDDDDGPQNMRCTTS